MKNNFTFIIMWLLCVFSINTSAQTQFWIDTFQDTGAPINRIEGRSGKKGIGIYSNKAIISNTFDFETNVTGYGTHSFTNTVSGKTLVVTSQSANVFRGSDFGLSPLVGFESILFSDGSPPETSVSFSIQGGQTFDLVSFKIRDETFSGPTATITTSKGSATFNTPSNGSTSTVNSSGFTTPSNFQGITSFTITAGSGFILSMDNLVLNIIDSTSQVLTSGSLNAFYSCSGIASTQQSFTVSGTNLTSNIVVTPPNGFEVSTTSGSGFASSVTLPQNSGSVSSTTIYVRLASSASGAPSGNITCVSTGATPINVAISGTVNANPSTTSGSQINVSCNGASNGAATIIPSGGSSPYTYSWSPSGGTGSTASNLSAGSYTVTVTDSNSCSATRTFTITQPTAVTVTQNSQTNIACFGGNNGAASINTPTGGAFGYTYNWTPGNPTGDGTNSVTGLNAGTWTCTVTDANACTASRTFTITQPTAVTVTPNSQTNISCFGGSNGAAQVGVSGGAGGYTYNWTPGNPTGDGTNSVTGLTAGTWTCTVTDANSCTAFQSFTITQPTAISATPASQTNISCFGGSNGAAQVGVSGGAGGYTYNWTPGNPTGDGTNSVTGLTAGTWTCTVTDANSCTAIQTFTITQPNALVATTSAQTNITCNGGSNGSATVSVTGGTPGYNYSWSPSGGTTDTASGLSAGTYTVTITDANSCTAIQSFTITQPNAVTTPILQTTQTFCLGNNLTNLVASVSSGDTLVWYASPSGSTALVNTTLLQSGNTYYAEALNSIGCSSVRIPVLTIFETILPTVVTQNITASLNAAGTASITAAQINNGSTDNCSIASVTVSPSSFTCANVGPNTVTLTVTDVNGNVTTGTAIVTVVDTTLPTVVTQNITASLNAAGTATISASQVNNGSTDNCGIASITASPTTFTCSNIGANTVTLTVTDLFGNSSTGTAVVTVTDAILPTVVTQNISLALNTSGLATITAAQINNGSTDNCGIASISVSPTSFTSANIGANTVTLTVTDVNGNINTATAIVTIQDNIPPTVVTQNISLALNASGTATITASQVNNGSTDNVGIASITVSPTTFTCSNVGANTVTLTVTDANGNSSTGTAVVTVTETTLPVVITQPVTVLLNASGTATITASQVNNGSTDNCAIASISVSPTSFTCANLGVNTVTLTVIDINGNVATGTAVVTVTIDNSQIGNNDIDALPDNCDDDDDNDGILDINDNCQFLANLSQIDTDGDGIGDFCDNDDDNDGVNDADDNCPLVYNPSQDDRDNDGLGDVCDTIELNISESITPNGDQINDTWQIYNIENYPNSVVRVINRWGSEVFYAQNYKNDWDGRSNDSNSTLPSSGSYFYQIDIENDGSVDYQGWLYITQ